MKEDHGTGSNTDQLQQDCLSAFIRVGTLDLSLDQLGAAVGTSKRMLIHYFGSRENLEEKVIDLFENLLREKWAVSESPTGASLATVVQTLWAQLTSPESWGILLLTMDISRRGWMGSERGRAFYLKQLRLWEELFLKFLPDPQAVGELLQMLQGSILVYLITGDRKQGADALQRMVQRVEKAAKPRWLFMR
jgi:AcrR family transcriptional regulator